MWIAIEELAVFHVGFQLQAHPANLSLCIIIVMSKMESFSSIARYYVFITNLICW